MLSEKQWNILIVSGQVLFFLGAVIFSFYALDTQKEINEYRDKLRDEGCMGVKDSEAGVEGGFDQYLEMNTSNTSSSETFNSSTTLRGR